MTTPLTLTAGRNQDGSALLVAVGEIDMSNTDAFAAGLDATTGRLVLDLSAVEYLDSAALSVLFAHADRLEVISNPLLEPVFALTGLASIITIRPPARPA